ncbi:MAG TPA: thiol:disulfide interchange protein DsbA/DsbL [Steroidobacteraceae bacterium]|nr:thiol:disulfide interchange protein DsbA/DsbL [Steroidobacteraceae bacterium]
MRYLLLWLLSLPALSTMAAAADAPWIEGQHYFRVEPAQPTQVPPGKVEVIEIFSYACPACNAYYPVLDKLKAALPKQARLSYLPASWHPEEDWQTFQRAFFAAQSLGLVERTHDAVFDAIWKTGELAIMDPVTKRPKAMMPTVIDVAKFYARKTGVKPEAFIGAAHTFSVDARMREADAQIRAYQADGTPTVIVDGRYRLTPQTAGGDEPFVRLVTWLVAQRIAHHL